VHRERVQLSSGKLNVSAFVPFVDLLESHNLVEFSSSSPALASEIVPRVGSSRQRDFDVKNASFEIRKKKKILSFSHIFKKCNRAYRSHDTIALGHATRERKQEVKKTDAV